MTTINRICVAALVAAASLTFSSPAWSLGLGDITVESFLNQPLQVKIDLIGRDSADMETVTARLASADDYELIGASRDAVPVPIRFKIEDAEGEAFIIGTSELPIGNPVIRLIVEVNWASGRLLREYTVFLDPPTFSDPAPIPRIDKRKEPRAVTTPATVPVDLPEADEEQASLAQTAGARGSSRELADGEYGPVGSGETLWGIASDWSRGTGLEINRVMIAIQRENPGAFLNGNINLLKRGAILRMPGVDDVRTISAATANSEVSAQAEQFRSRRFRETAASTATPLLAEEAAAFEQEQSLPEPVEVIPAESPPGLEDSDSAAIDLTAAAEVVVETEEAEVMDQLELVPPSEESELDSAYGFEEAQDAAPDASLVVSTLREDLARKEEELIAEQQQNEYLAERIQELEAQLLAAEEDSVGDADLANMQDRLERERLAAAAQEQDDEKSWYSRVSTWWIGLLVLLVALVGWVLSRRGGGDQFVSDLGSGDSQLREIKDEAEEVLRVLDDSAEVKAPADDVETVEVPVQDESTVRQFGASGDEAEVLDEESSDPEIQLDLARAYISMGDKEAARVILDEVGANGTEEQRAEAKKMLDLLVP